MSTERFACNACGAIFAAGYGPDNIVSTPYERADARRKGECPVCDHPDPEMWEVWR